MVPALGAEKNLDLAADLCLFLDGLLLLLCPFTHRSPLLLLFKRTLLLPIIAQNNSEREKFLFAIVI